MANPRTYLPQKESELVTWSANMKARISADPARYSLTVQQSTDYGALHDAFAAAYTAANQGITRTPTTIVIKNDAKEALIDGPGGIRELVDFIQGNPATTNEMRSELQITIRDTEPTPAPKPTKAPTLKIESQDGRTVRIRLRDVLNPDSRAKPKGVKGALVYSFVGEQPPVSLVGWTMLKNTSRTLFNLIFDGSVPDGSKVWLTAQWYNTRSESGPASTPVSIYIGGVALAA